MEHRRDERDVQSRAQPFLRVRDLKGSQDQKGLRDIDQKRGEELGRILGKYLKKPRRDSDKHHTEQRQNLGGDQPEKPHSYKISGVLPIPHLYGEALLFYHCEAAFVNRAEEI